MLSRFLASSRYMVILAVLGAFLGSVVLSIYGVYESIRTLLTIFGELNSFDVTGKELLVTFVAIVDYFLVATVLYLISIGLYELFIDDSIPVPGWAEIHNLDDLKEKLLAGVVVVLAVFFLSQLVSWKGGIDLLYLGLGIAAMIAALRYFLSGKQNATENAPGKL